jgi:hydrogenase maturation protease
MKKIKVIGCGSLLMGDDAVGCVVARELLEENLPENVEVVEAGTPGLNLLCLMEPGERVIIVDAVVTGEREEGEMEIFLESRIPKPSQMPLSAHSIAIPEAIALGKQVQPELMPDSIEIWGIEVKTPVIEKMEMTEKIKKAVPGVIRRLLKELAKS